MVQVPWLQIVKNIQGETFRFKAYNRDMTKFERSRRSLRRIIIGIVGGTVVLIGIVAIPYPGPGWAIVFVGFAILATEFDWAQNILDYLKTRYEQWQVWIKEQSKTVQVLFFTLTAVVVIVTVYLLNGYGYLNDWLNLNKDWLNSPLPFFN